MRVLVYAIALTYLAFTAFNDLVLKPSFVCGTSDGDILAKPLPNLTSALSENLRKLDRENTEMVLSNVWAAQGYPLEHSEKQWNGRKVWDWTVVSPGTTPAKGTLGIATHFYGADEKLSHRNHSTLATLLVLSGLAQKFPHTRSIRFMALRWEPKSSTSAPDTSTQDSLKSLIYLDENENDDSAQTTNSFLSRLFPSFFPKASADTLVSGDFQSRGLVNIAGGVFKQSTELPALCVRQIPLMPKVATTHSALFAGIGIPTVFFSGNREPATIDAQQAELSRLQRWTQGWFHVLHVLSEGEF